MEVAKCLALPGASLSEPHINVKTAEEGEERLRKHRVRDWARRAVRLLSGNPLHILTTHV